MKISQWKVSVGVILGALSVAAHAEYYMVYPAPEQVVYTSDCGCRTSQHYSHPRYHRVSHHHRVSHVRRSYYHIDVEYVWYAYPGEVLVTPPPQPCCCGGRSNYQVLRSRYSTTPARYEHDDDATYYAPDLDRSTADDVDPY